MNVPFADLPAQHAALKAELDEAVGKVFAGASFILGDAVKRFEDAFAPVAGRAHCVGLNSGTSALHLALLAAGVGPGDEVVTTPHTFIATAWGISYCGATPVFADVDPATGNLDPAAAERAITPKTKAILPVDLYGNPADWTAFEALAARRKVALVEDACQAHGAAFRGRAAGSFGRLACFSFYPGKNLGAAGEGGAAVTDDPALAERMRRLRDHGQSRKHRHEEIGFNYRMEGLQGAVLGVKLRRLAAWTAARRAAAARYDEALAGIPGVTRPAVTPGAEPVWHVYAVRVAERDRVAAALEAEGVSTGVHYPTPVHLQPAYASLGHRPGAFPAAERFAAECLSLPMFAELAPGQIDHVAAALRRAVRA